MGQIFPIAVLGFKLHLRPLRSHDTLRGRQCCLGLGKSCRPYPAPCHAGVKGAWGRDVPPLVPGRRLGPSSTFRGPRPGDHTALPASTLALGDGLRAWRCGLATLSSARSGWKSMLSTSERPLNAYAPDRFFCPSVPSLAQSHPSFSKYLLLGSAAPSGWLWWEKVGF